MEAAEPEDHNALAVATLHSGGFSQPIDHLITRARPHCALVADCLITRACSGQFGAPARERLSVLFCDFRVIETLRARE